MKLDEDVDKMMDQLTAAEKELEKKKAEADADMMMASMVGYIDWCLVYSVFECIIAEFTLWLTLLSFSGIRQC